MTQPATNPGDPASGDELSLADAIRLCRENPTFLAGLASVLHDVDDAVAQKGAICLGGGGCCKFDLAGHRLYASSGEIALLLGQSPPHHASLPPLRCAYQLGPRCIARDRRPLGCRTYFCDPTLSQWFPELYEAAHARIRQLHQQFNLPYRYCELTTTLATLAGLGAVEFSGTAQDLVPVVVRPPGA